MKVFTLRREMWVPRPLHEVFDFFSRAENLQEITPAWMHFRILTPQPIAMHAGTLIDYALRIHGIPAKWRTRIESWNPPHEFVDLQQKGPYRLWRHTHQFVERNGGTQITDEVRYALPFGFLGQMVHRLQVSRDLARIFDYRAQRVGELLAAATDAAQRE